MKFGITLEPKGTTYDDILKVAEEADALGFDSVWLPDHFFFSQEPYHECWTTLSSIAEATDHVRLGQMVLCNSYRNPALLGKMAATLDAVSNGRMTLGLGAGWHQQEYDAYGIPFPQPRIRLHQLREAVQIILKMWTENSATFKGDHYTLQGSVFRPKPVQEPHPPIWIGGSGSKILKIVAELAGGCNFNFGKRLIFTAQEFQERLAILEGYCEKAGRDADEIAKSFSVLIALGMDRADVKAEMRAALQSMSGQGIRWRRQLTIAFHQPSLIVAAIKARLGIGRPKFLFSGMPDEIAQQLSELAQVGVTHALLNIPSSWRGDTSKVRLFAEKVMDSVKG